MVTYRVGSRNEVTGTTGATHLLEHLMFKGTEKFDRSKGTGFDQVLERIGAETNATTWLDRTNYFATVPENALPLLIEVEADRMRHLSLREQDRQPEMVVVRNEFERGENDPQSHAPNSDLGPRAGTLRDRSSTTPVTRAARRTGGRWRRRGTEDTATRRGAPPRRSA